MPNQNMCDKLKPVTAGIGIIMLLLLLSANAAHAQWVAQTGAAKVRLRGVSAVSAGVAWASGEKGTYARTVDGGATWQSATVPGAAELDFRDVDAFDADNAYLLSIGEGEKSRIYRTTDGGAHWKLQFQNAVPGAFYDAMAFWDRDHGIAVSDPVNGRFLIITTDDGGRTWKQMLPAGGMPEALAGEGAFAASGTCITVQGKRNVWFGTGGTAGARVFRSTDGGRTWKVAATPIISGKSAGIFSVVFRDAKRGVAVGGDYTKEREAKNNVALTRDGGQTWTLAPGAIPDGYRSGVAYFHGAGVPTLIAVGPSGSDYSKDQGASWQHLSDTGFHSVSFSTGTGAAGWAVGEQGSIRRYAGELPGLKVGAQGKP